jgi:hypothetical protein
VRWALLASVAVHVALGCLLLVRQRPRPASVADVVEVSFEVDEAGAARAGSTPAGAGMAARPAVEPAARAVGKPSDLRRGEATGAQAGQGATPAPDGAAAIVVLPPPGASGSANSDRLSIFRPAHPDLLGAGKAPPLEGKSRDLLASPLAKGEAAPRELPRLLHGSGGVTARVGEDGSIHFGGPKDLVIDDPSFQKVGEGAGVGLMAHLDITDQIMKLAGQDPYASAKRAIADETREQRLCMATRYQGERRKHELFNLASKVRRLAARADLSAAERRALVFDIWDECTEETESGPDYGAMARATIVAVVRDVFPAGTDRAYQPAELLALNQRRSSRQRFSPYDLIQQVERGRHPDAGAPGECPMP